jgi:hypothetical protein
VREALEGGVQEAVLYNGSLWWTAPSEEMMASLIARCVRGPNGAKATEWLSDEGRLLLLQGRLHYAGKNLYRLPSAGTVPEAPENLGSLPDRQLAGDGQSVVTLGGLTMPTVALVERR